ncbi:hypothetical protein FRC08_014209 [Ceratobasidium sp. 394]|nr:hypothetical protein FRC08_014209 [Ceratobasidium sp. 394]
MSDSVGGNPAFGVDGLLGSDKLCFTSRSAHDDLMTSRFQLAPVDPLESHPISLHSTPASAPKSLVSRRSKNNPRRTLWPSSQTNLPRLIDARYSPSSLPRGLSHVPPDVGNMVDFIMSQHERLIEFSFFKPSNRQVLNIRESVNRRIQSSGTVLWVIFLGTKILESILDGTNARKMPGYVQWITKFEKQLGQTSTQSLTSSGSQDHLTSVLEVWIIFNVCRN